MAREGALRQCGVRLPYLWVDLLFHLFPGLTLSEILRDLVWFKITEVFEDPHAVLRKLLFSKLYLRLEDVLDVVRHPNNGPKPPANARQLLLPWVMQEAA
jgi:hypothetical protein